MSKERASIFDQTPELDLSQFEPKRAGAKEVPPPREKVKAVAEAARFTSREPKAETIRVEEPKREQRRYRTGRNLQLSLKVSQDTLQRFYAVADANHWVLGHALERALQALERELKANQSTAT